MDGPERRAPRTAVSVEPGCPTRDHPEPGGGCYLRGQPGRLVASPSDVEPQREHAGAPHVVWPRYQQRGRSDVAHFHHGTTGRGSPIFSPVSRLSGPADVSPGATAFPTVHEHSGVLEPDGQHLVQRAAVESHPAVLPWLVVQFEFLLVEGDDDWHRDRRAESRYN